MDIIARNPETSIDKIQLYTLSAFVPLLEDRRTEIEQVERRTFKYGPSYRHNLDVYYPPQAVAKAPVLFFVYGGGFNTGARQLPAPYDMGYRALGAFFARRGFVVVVPDYRLVPEVRFPDASWDVAHAVSWVAAHPGEIRDAGPTPCEPDVARMFAMGHSAGAAHLMVATLHADIRRTLPPLRGVVWAAGLWAFAVDGEPELGTAGPVRFYFGDAAARRAREPRALWDALGEEDVRAHPEVLLVLAEREPRWMLTTGEMVARDVERRLGSARAPRRVVARGHNHVSTNWALCSGEGEEWAEEVVQWMQEQLAERDGVSR